MDADTGGKGNGAGPDQAQPEAGASASPVETVGVRRGPKPHVKIHSKPPQARRNAPARVVTEPDDLTKIRRIKPPLAEKLRRIGVLHFEQIAAWTSDDIRSLSAALNLGLSIYQENWIEQAAKFALKRSGSVVLPDPEGLKETPGETQAIHTAEAAEPEPSQSAGGKRPLGELVQGAASAILGGLRGRDEVRAEATQASPLDGETQPGLAELAKSPSAQLLALQVNLACEAIRPGLPKAEASFPVTLTPQIPPGSEQVSGEEADASLDPAPISPSMPGGNVAAEAASGAPIANGTTEASQQDLTLIRNMPLRVAIRLEELGVTRFSEVADFDADDVAALSVDCGLGDQICDECWIEQAAILASGGLTKGARLLQQVRPGVCVPYAGETLKQDDWLVAELAARAERQTREKADQALPEKPPETMAEIPDADIPETNPPVRQASKPMVTELQVPKPREDWTRNLATSSAKEQPSTAAPSRTNDPRKAAPSSLSKERPPHAPQPEARILSEAEVSFKPKAASGLVAAEDSSKANGSESRTIGSDAASTAPGSLTSKLGRAGEPNDMNPDDYAAYHREIEEASVEIVRHPSGSGMRNNASGPSAPAAQEASQSRAVSRFLKALRGH